MKIATISTGSGYLYPSEFTKDEIAFAKSKGVILKTQYSNTIGKNYVANTCPKCGSFVGNHFLFTQYIVPASYDELLSQSFEIGYYCNYCNN